MIRREVVSYLAASLFLLGTGVGAIGALLAGRSDLVVIGMATLGLPLIISASYLVLFPRPRLELIKQAFSLKILHILFFSSIVASGLVLINQPYRGFLFFILLSLAFTVVGFQVLHVTDQPPWIVVTNCCLLLFYASASVTLRLPLYFGASDIISHLHTITYVMNTSNIVPQSITNYANFPLFHLFVATFSKIAGTSPQTGMFLSAGLAFSVTPAIIYCITSVVTERARIPLLATFLYTALPTVLYHGTYVITRTMAYIGFLLVLLVMLTKLTTPERRFSYLLFVFTAYILLVHQVTYIQIMFILAILFVVSAAVDHHLRSFPMYDFLLLGSVFLAYLIFRADDLFERILLRNLLGYNLDISSAGGGSSISFHTLEYLNNTIFVGFLFVGIVVALNNRNRWITKIGIFTAVFSMFAVYSPIHTINRLSALRLDRLMLLLAPFIAICLALGTADVLSRTVEWNSLTQSVVIVSIMALFTLTSLMGSIYYDTASDSPEIDHAYPENHFEKSDLAALHHIEYIPHGESIRTDRHAVRYVSSLPHLGGNFGGQRSPYQAEMLSVSEQQLDSYILVRERAINSKGIYVGSYNSPTLQTTPIDFPMNNQIYNNGGAQIYS